MRADVLINFRERCNNAAIKKGRQAPALMFELFSKGLTSTKQAAQSPACTAVDLGDHHRHRLMIEVDSMIAKC